MMAAATLHEFGTMAGQHGPWLAVIIVLLRSNAAKDKVISDLTAQALRMLETTQRVVEAKKEGQP